MSTLKNFRQLNIDWDLSPEDAVTLYLEWGNNNWRGPFPPVRSKEDYATYFVVDTWGASPKIRLLRRNSEKLEELAEVELPEMLNEDFAAEYGTLRGVFEPTSTIKAWLKAELE
ncbi:MAG: hypothetical protein LBI88_01490 [Deltaproteobacteria bacterium]|jgi:hypothetical protein|nr:hypothetical protein [Deltaproteobacteria bacterium]